MPPAPASALDRYIAQKFRNVGVRFYHAENLHDFAVYCRARALLARTELRRFSAGFTTFYSDKSDEERGVLSRVFGNLRDFGVFMACGRGAIPNVYGPIQLVFRPDCFAQMSDIVLTKKSIVNLDDSWRTQAASTAQAIDHIASGRANDDHVSRDWMYAELSCAESYLSFEFLEEVIVEPIIIAGRRLCDVVRGEVHMAGFHDIRITERVYQRLANLDALRAIVGFCETLPDDLSQESPSIAAASGLPEFADRPPDRQRRLGLWARYFYFGTVTELRTRARQFGAMMDAADAADTRVPCEQCDPSENTSPAMVSFQPLFIGGMRSKALEEGTCDYCNSITLRCLHCGELTPVPPRPGRHEMRCSGECGIEFAVTQDDSIDGMAVDIELINEITPENVSDELIAILQTEYEEEFIRAVSEGEYPVSDIELDQLVVTLGATPGTATVEWGFGASHHSEYEIGFGGAVTASVTFDADAVNRSALTESVAVDEVEAHFDMGDEDD